MSNLQLALIVAGALLVIGVIIFNVLQERRIRRRIDAAFRPSDDTPPAATGRVEPTLRARNSDANARGEMGAVRVETASDGQADAATASTFTPPMDVIATLPADAPATPDDHHDMAPAASPTATGAQPDPDIECIVTVRPAQAVGVADLAAGLHARLGKPLRWFGHRGGAATWQLLSKDTPGAFVELAACLLLADRNGAISRAQLETFVRVIGEVASTLPAVFAAPLIDDETERAQALDQLCADLDVQIGLTVMKPESAPIPGTRLRGVAEAAGFHLVSGGRFELVNEETGTVDYALQNVRDEPFTAESLRLTATHGVVFILDVPRLPDPIRSFDRMKLAAKRMAHTLGGALVDDNQRVLDDAALAAIRAQVEAAALALKRGYIEPGSGRALALFGA